MALWPPPLPPVFIAVGLGQSIHAFFLHPGPGQPRLCVTFFYLWPLPSTSPALSQVPFSLLFAVSKKQLQRSRQEHPKLLVYRFAASLPSFTRLNTRQRFFFLLVSYYSSSSHSLTISRDVPTIRRHDKPKHTHTHTHTPLPYLTFRLNSRAFLCPKTLLSHDRFLIQIPTARIALLPFLNLLQYIQRRTYRPSTIDLRESSPKSKRSLLNPRRPRPPLLLDESSPEPPPPNRATLITAPRAICYSRETAATTR